MTTDQVLSGAGLILVLAVGSQVLASLWVPTILSLALTWCLLSAGPGKVKFGI